MARILVVEKSPLIATDIVETAGLEMPLTRSVAVTTIEDAEKALKEPDGFDICIVSGSTTRERLGRLAIALNERRTQTILITDDARKLDDFRKGTVHLPYPFTSSMLAQAVRKVSPGG